MVKAVIEILILSRYRQLKTESSKEHLAFSGVKVQPAVIGLMRYRERPFSQAEPDLLRVAEPVAPDGIVDARAYCCTLTGTQVLSVNLSFNTRQSLNIVFRKMILSIQTA